MCDVLHWLPASKRISYRIAALVWRCLTGSAPSYLSDLCRPVSDLASRRALRSSAKGSYWSLGPAPRSDSVEPSRLLAPPLGMGSRLRYAYCPGIICLLSTNCSSPFSLAVAGLGAPLSRLLEEALYKFPE